MPGVLDILMEQPSCMDLTCLLLVGEVGLRMGLTKEEQMERNLRVIRQVRLHGLIIERCHEVSLSLVSL